MDIKSYQNCFCSMDINFGKSILVVLFFVIVLFFIVVFNNNFYDYYSGVGVVEGDNNLNISVSINDLDKVLNNNKIIVERTTFTYKVVSISSDIVYGTDIFKRIVISLDLPDYLNVNNNYINYRIVTGNDTIMNYIFKVVKGE